MKYLINLQGFSDMHRWICLMTVQKPPATPASPFRRNQFSSRSFSVPSSRPSIRSSPMSDYLYSPQSHSPNSPYSSYFASSKPKPVPPPLHLQHSIDTASSSSNKTSLGDCLRLMKYFLLRHSLSGSDSPSTLTSPELVSSSMRSLQSPRRQTVFNSLCKPDLIKLSSPLQKKNDLFNFNRQHSSINCPMNVDREEMTSKWISEN